MNLKSPTITQVWSNQPCLRMAAWCLFVFFTVPGQGQTNHGLLKKADQSYIKQDFTKAEENYRKALEQKSTETTKYNLGNAIMEQNRPDEAVTFYEDATKKQNDQSLKSKAWHNLGNALYLKKEYENSIKAYKESLKISPDDLDTKKNLVLAKKQLLKQQQQQQNQDPPKDQNNQDQQQQPSSGEDQKGQQEQKKESPSQPQQMSKEEAEQLLQYTEREDQKVQAKLRNKESKTAKPKKDW